MANFPNSVTTFATRSAGQSIASAHMNSVQDEINAIEDGYLSGTARLNSSNSTVATLSVAGGSTFASRPVMPPPDAARLTIDADLNVPNGSTTAVPWTAQTILTNSSMHSTATNPSQVSPQSTGVYLCCANITWNTLTSTRFIARIHDSSGGDVVFHQARPVNGQITQSLSGLKRFDTLSATPWVRVVVLTDGSTNSLDRTTSFLQMHKL